MTQTPHRYVAARTKELRKRHGWSQVRLAEMLTAVGVEWDRSIVANFEGGRRAYVTVEEVLALAYVFNVAPVNLMVPIRDVPYRVLPQPLSADESHLADAEPLASTVREWFVGREPLLGTDIRTFFSEVPEEEFRRRVAVVGSIQAKRDQAARGQSSGPGLAESDVTPENKSGDDASR